MRTRAVSTSPAAIVAAAALAVAPCGCGTSKQSQLEAVAKDWSMVIRASQVMPVYPLTEDIQPGDVFLVQVPIDEQQSLYKKKGYLALDNHVARLDPEKYGDFYSHSFVLPDGTILPNAWMRPKPPAAGAEPIPAWSPAPHAAFPSYSFSVRRGAGLNLAVPVSGVPVGLSLLASDAADGNINIKKASTLGVDTVSVYRQVQRWARENQDFLRNFAPRGERTNYLRVVTRVYVTGELEVSLNDSSRAGAGVDAGVPKPVDLLTATAPTSTGDVKAVTLDDYLKNIDKLNAGLATDKLYKTLPGGAQELLPGGSLRVTAASSRSISMSEKLDPPLVLGYLGFDCAIAKGGLLGPPIPTHSVVDDTLGGQELLEAAPLARIYESSVTFDVYQVLSGRGAAAAPYVAGLDSLERFVPSSLTTYLDGPRGLVESALAETDLRPAGFRGFERFTRFVGRVDASIASLQAALAKDSFVLLRGGSPVTVNRASPERAELSTALARLREVRADAEMESARAAAIAEAMRFYSETYEE